jgi:hypothetical protein
MKGRSVFFALIFFFLLVTAFLTQVPLSGHTRIQLKEAATGRRILSQVLRDGEEVVMTWKNSLFRLTVTEVYKAQGGVLVLAQITFADPQGSAPPRVTAADVDDLYQTGGAFTAGGLTKPFHQVVHRVGEIGEPRMRVRGREVAFQQEVGFGGSIVLTAAAAKGYEILLESGDR